MFDDVSIFDHRGGEEHYCHSCGFKHNIPTTVDVLASGPSCKSISKMFVERAAYQKCFLSFD